MSEMGSPRPVHRMGLGGSNSRREGALEPREPGAPARELHFVLGSSRKFMLRS